MEEDREKIMKLMEDILRVLSKVDNKLWHEKKKPLPM